MFFCLYLQNLIFKSQKVLGSSLGVFLFTGVPLPISYPSPFPLFYTLASAVSLIPLRPPFLFSTLLSTGSAIPLAVTTITSLNHLFFDHDAHGKRPRAYTTIAFRIRQGIK